MKTKILTGTFLMAALLAVGIKAAPQQSPAAQTQQDQTTPAQQQPGMTGCGQGMMMGQGQGQGMMGQGQGMMGGNMMGMMGQMSTHHQQMNTLMNKLMASMTAIQNEKDPAALKTKLAEHKALLEKMRGNMRNQGKMMQEMSGEMMQNCPAMNGSVKPTPGG
jgi:hypothetical protein